MFGLWIRFLKSIYFEYSQNSSKKKKKTTKKLIILLITPPQKGKGASSALSIYLQESDHRCTHLSCVRSKNESECINFQCQNFRAFVALKSVSRIVISIFNKTRTTDRTMVGTRQKRVIIGLQPISHLFSQLSYTLFFFLHSQSTTH